MTAVIVPPPPRSARDKFVEAVIALEGRTVVWGALDCSETVALGVLAAGGPDQRSTHRAQTYHDETRSLLFEERPVPGDLGFYGVDRKHIIHVVIFVASGRILSADGATSRIRTHEEAVKANARVRFHASEHYRRDVPFQGWHRNTIVDSIDFVTR